MAKEVAGLIKLQIKGGAANPSPPVGPALGSKGIKDITSRNNLLYRQVFQLCRQDSSSCCTAP